MPRNWIAVHAHNRSRAGAFDDKIEIDCAWCGAPIFRNSEFCSRNCEDEARNEALNKEKE